MQGAGREENSVAKVLHPPIEPHEYASDLHHLVTPDLIRWQNHLECHHVIAISEDTEPVPSVLYASDILALSSLLTPLPSPPDTPSTYTIPFNPASSSPLTS